MDLKEVIKTTITQIIEGISEADAAAQKLGASVNPSDVKIGEAASI